MGRDLGRGETPAVLVLRLRSPVRDFGSLSFMLRKLLRRSFCLGNKLWQGLLDLPQFQSGKVMANGACRNRDQTAIPQLFGYGFAGCLAPSDDVDGELLNQFGLHFRGDAVIGLLPLAFVDQRSESFAIEALGKCDGVCHAQTNCLFMLNPP